MTAEEEEFHSLHTTHGAIVHMDLKSEQPRTKQVLLQHSHSSNCTDEPYFLFWTCNVLLGAHNFASLNCIQMGQGRDYETSCPLVNRSSCWEISGGAELWELLCTLRTGHHTVLLPVSPLGRAALMSYEGKTLLKPTAHPSGILSWGVKQKDREKERESLLCCRLNMKVKMKHWRWKLVGRQTLCMKSVNRGCDFPRRESW